MGNCKKIFTGILSGMLAFIFITAGVLKVTPRLSVEAHKRLYKDFVQYSKLHPAVQFGYEIDPKKFMPQVGFIEIVAGIFLVIGPRITRLISCLILSSIMVGALYFVHKSNKPIEELAVPALVLLLSFIRLNLFFSPTLQTKTATTKAKKNTKKETKKEK